MSDAGKVSEVWFEWKAVEADSRTQAPGEGETPVTVASAFSHTLNGLSADTEYEYHTVAKLTSGRTISGNEIRFRTPKETPPADDDYDLSPHNPFIDDESHGAYTVKSEIRIVVCGYGGISDVFIGKGENEIPAYEGSRGQVTIDTDY